MRDYQLPTSDWKTQSSLDRVHRGPNIGRNVIVSKNTTEVVNLLQPNTVKTPTWVGIPLLTYPIHTTLDSQDFLVPIKHCASIRERKSLNDFACGVEYGYATGVDINRGFDRIFMVGGHLHGFKKRKCREYCDGADEWKIMSRNQTAQLGQWRAGMDGVCAACQKTEILWKTYSKSIERKKNKAVVGGEREHGSLGGQKLISKNNSKKIAQRTGTWRGGRAEKIRSRKCGKSCSQKTIVKN